MDDYSRLRKVLIFDGGLDFPRLLAKIHAINRYVNGIEWPTRRGF